MFVFQPKYRAKDDRYRKSSKWWVRIADHHGIQRQFPGFNDKRMTQSMGQHLQDLVNCLHNTERPDAELRAWIDRAPKATRDKLQEYHMIDPATASGTKSLLSHLADFDCEKADQETSRDQRALDHQRIKEIIEGCGFARWSDVNEPDVLSWLRGIRTGEIKRINPKNGRERKRINKVTSNYYLRAFKQFTAWMVRRRRAAEDPMAETKYLVVSDADRVHLREAFTVAEIQKLLEAARQGPVRHGLAGPERALLYRFAAETGLRGREIRRLRVRSLVTMRIPEGQICVVRLKGGETKNLDKDTVPLADEMVTELRAYTAERDPNDWLFHGDGKEGTLTKQTAKMLKKDLAAAGIPYTDDDRYKDFHAFRHTTDQWLTNLGVHPKVVQWVMRHKVMRMGEKYTREDLGLMAAGIRKLASLGRSRPGDAQTQKQPIPQESDRKSCAA